MATSKFDNTAKASILKDKAGQNELLHIAYRSLLSKDKLQEYYPNEPVKTNADVYKRISNRVRRYIKTHGIELLDAYNFDQSTINVGEFIQMFVTQVNNKVAEHIAEKTGKIARGEPVSVSPVPEVSMKQPRKANIIKPEQRAAIVAAQAGPSAPVVAAQAGPSAPVVAAPAGPSAPKRILGVRQRSSSNKTSSSSSSTGRRVHAATENQLARLMGNVGMQETAPKAEAAARKHIEKRTKVANPQEQMAVDRRTAAIARQEAAKLAKEQKERRDKEMHEQAEREKTRKRELKEENKGAIANVEDLVRHFGL
jgi:hypothetical protein